MLYKSNNSCKDNHGPKCLVSWLRTLLRIRVSVVGSACFGVACTSFGNKEILNLLALADTDPMFVRRAASSKPAKMSASAPTARTAMKTFGVRSRLGTQNQVSTCSNQDLQMLLPAPHQERGIGALALSEALGKSRGPISSPTMQTLLEVAWAAQSNSGMPLTIVTSPVKNQVLGHYQGRKMCFACLSSEIEALQK